MEHDLLQAHAAASTANQATYRQSDALLRLTIAETAGIPSLTILTMENRARVNEWFDTFPLMPRNIEHSDGQHARMVDAIVNGDVDEAVAATVEHRAGSEALLRGFLS